MTPTEQLERLPLGRRQHALVGILSSAVVLDGLDVKILAYAAPLILAEWHIDKASFGPVMAAAVIGMTIGTPIGGWAGDRLGRRAVILASLLLFGLATIGAGMAHDPFSMGLLRFISGLGFGAVTPNAYALAAEWLPVKTRMRTTALLTIGFPVGGMLGALLMLALLPLAGWRECFYVAGAFTLVNFLVASRWMPESVQFLQARGRTQAAALAWRRTMGSDLPSSSAMAADAHAPASAEDSAGSIFSAMFIRTSLATAACYFSIQFISYAVASWGPVIFTSAGLPISDALLGSISFNVFAIVLTFAVIPVARRFGSRLTMLASCVLILGAIAIMAYCLLRGISGGSLAGRGALILSFGLVGGLCGVVFQLLNAIATNAYPSRLRATGVGFAATGGRAGAIVAILAGGVLLTWGGDNPSMLLLLLGALAVSIMPGALMIDRHLESTLRPPLADGERALRRAS